MGIFRPILSIKFYDAEIRRLLIEAIQVYVDTF